MPTDLVTSKLSIQKHLGLAMLAFVTTSLQNCQFLGTCNAVEFVKEQSKINTRINIIKKRM